MIPFKRALLAAAVAAFWFGVATTLVSAPADDRFDHKVRDKFFAGFAGDRAAFAEGMKICEEVLAENPKHAEAMVWYGTGILLQASDAFRAGNYETGYERMKKSVETMDKAVELAPDQIGVRIPRGAALLSASRFLPKDQADPLLERGLKDYERVLALQAAYFDNLGEHPRGELLFGLADGWSRAGDEAKATAYFERIIKELPAGPYTKRAQKWLETRQLTNAERNCIGCHVRK